MRLALVALVSALPLFPQTFEVASVRQHHGADVFRAGPLEVSGTLVRLDGYTVYGLIMDAWNLSDIVVAPHAAASPEDIYNTMYDVVGRAPGDSIPSTDAVRAMLRSLLADRFGLKTHLTKKESAVYRLTAVGARARLMPVVSRRPCSIRAESAANGRNQTFTFSSCTMEFLADRLSGLTDRPVIDATGLTGKYDFALTATADSASRRGSDPADIPPGEAVRRLGLKLSEGHAQLDQITVEHLDKLKEN